MMRTGGAFTMGKLIYVANVPFIPVVMQICGHLLGHPSFLVLPSQKLLFTFQERKLGRCFLLQEALKIIMAQQGSQFGWVPIAYLAEWLIMQLWEKLLCSHQRSGSIGGSLVLAGPFSRILSVLTGRGSPVSPTETFFRN